jgi:hypothetical protein
VQRRARAFVDHPQPADHPAGGQPLLVGGVDLPDVMRVLGPVTGFGPASTGRGRGQAMPAEPTLEGAVRGDLDPGAHPSQLDPDADGPPTGMLAAESEDRLHQGGLGAGVTTAGVIAGDQTHEGPITGLRLRGTSDQISDRAEGQVELPGDLRRGGPEPGHPGDGQARREFGGTWHRSGLPDPRTKRILGLYRRAEMHGTFVSGFRTKLGVA